MDFINYFIKMVIAIINFQLTVVNTGNAIGNLRGNKFSALEVIENEKYAIYLPMQGNVDLNKTSSKPQKYLYFCPPQKRIEWQQNFIEKLGRNCLFYVASSKKHEENVNYCDSPVTPNVFAFKQNRDSLCGENRKGIKLRLQLELYLPRPIFIDDPIDENKYKKTAKETTNFDNTTIIFPIYTFCFEYKKHRTAFVTYNIVSTDMSENPFPEKFHTSLPSIDKRNDNDPFQQQDPHLCYKKENQNLQEEFGDSITKLRDDYLVEQTMASWQDINYDLERGGIKNYINVAPQWKSIRDDWNKLSTFIKKISLERRQNSIDDGTVASKFEEYESGMRIAEKGIYMGFQVTCGTYGEFDRIRLGKVGSEERSIPQNQLDQWNQSQEEQFYKMLGMDEASLKQLLESNETKPNDHVSPETSSSNPPEKSALILTAPLYWWKLITYREEGIVLIMPNIPKSMPELFDKYEPLCTDICVSRGWEEVQTFNELIICCEPTQELLGKLISSNANTWEWKIPTRILRLKHDTFHDTKNQN